MSTSINGTENNSVSESTLSSSSSPSSVPPESKSRSKSKSKMTLDRASPIAHTRGYQQEMLEESLRNNIIIAMDTGSGKTHIAVLRLKIEAEREMRKISWFLAPTVALCEQQHEVIDASLPVSVGLITGSLEPDQWKDDALWRRTLEKRRVVVSTPQVLLDALHHGYIVLGRDIGLLIFDEAHHATDKHPYNCIMQDFYLELPPRMRRIVRPMIMGLTASPIFGGNVDKAFEMIEKNLDSIIRAPRLHREELSQFVHKPVFKHVMYNSPDSNPQFSTNLASLQYAVGELNIEDDPYVHSLQRQLAKATPESREWKRVDQRLSKTIQKEDTFTHKGLKDFLRTGEAILQDVGAWAADWYVWKVLNKARMALDPLQSEMMPSWRDREKEYLRGIVNNIHVLEPSYQEDDIIDDVSDKVVALIECLLTEKEESESRNDRYSGLVFVERRDVVLALTEVLRNHPVTKDAFQVDLLVGTSESSRRHSFLDITRHIVKQSQDKTLMDFRIGEKNLIVSTAVAEEGIDVQACGCVIRWDPPSNMASWAQSRGRARQRHSTFTLMFEQGSASRRDVEKWENLEREMVARYNDPLRDMLLAKDDDGLGEEDGNKLEFRVESTGALLTLQSAIPHLNHFCAVMPSRDHVDFRPIYELDPPDYPIGWHSIAHRSTALVNPYQGPWRATVTLPRSLPDQVRVFTTREPQATKRAAYQFVAFETYLALYRNGLLSDHLLPLTDHEMEQADEEIEKMVGLANVSGQMDPWTPEFQRESESPSASASEEDWFYAELTIGDLPPLHLITRNRQNVWTEEDGPILYLPTGENMQVTLRPLGSIDQLADPAWFIESAREYTFMLFSSINGSRMELDRRDFPYLFHPADGSRDDTWVECLESLQEESEYPIDGYNMNALDFGMRYEFPDDISMVREGGRFGKPYQFVEWQWEELDEDEMETLVERYGEVLVEYPLLKVRSFHPRTNFLIVLLSQDETRYAFILPSVIRAMSMALTTQSLRKNLFGEVSPLCVIPDDLLTVAITAPVSQERQNYQRLETLGDTVLKFVVVTQLLAEYPTWPEGYLTKRKDQAVSNSRLARENFDRRIFQWIIRDRMLGKKWKPQYEGARFQPETSTTGGPEFVDAEQASTKAQKKKKKKSKNSEQMSKKVLADVIESLIGAAYLTGGLDLGCECVKFFGLGLRNWLPLSQRVESLIQAVREPDELPPQVLYVERILDYTFTRKLLLVEALTHPTYQQNLGTVSYERLEFLGDSILDMVCTDYLYRAEGKNYSPGHMHMRKSAMVNAHMLAFLCLRASTDVSAEMPRPDAVNGEIRLRQDNKTIYLEQCLFHSSSKVLEEQRMTLRRFEMRQEEIEYGLKEDDIFPWAALTRLQAPKFLSDMVESIIGAVFLDSEGNFDVIRRVLRELGFMEILEHIVRDNVDVMHPVSRVALWASKKGKKVTYLSQEEKGNVSCSVLLDEEPLEGATETDVKHGKRTFEEVRFAAAEKATKILGIRTNPSKTK
ncbi:P-loop containing nucleoside triphosphate hydrolase protein [Dendrothele bispora CBS 962.96]|uniref:P-loop containing nucleoside triphosphate hydrolase protein n=1 Tax=Dendrothele bispora (strain CBS 962.96) TaxID=1314807 RepID=A0A4S8LD23_DENBC|nr:P-loop containing nucleoside triphosphate hydrolase protein [Dendrothele bispora CBS 962.96]